MKKEIVKYLLTRTVPLLLLFWIAYAFAERYLPVSPGWVHVQKLAAAFFGVYLGVSAANHVRAILDRHKNS